MHPFPRFAAVVTAALLAAPCLATDVTVTASGMSFTPANVTILVGDTVTFTNAGGFHNVATDDGTFRCAETCGDQNSGSDGAASSGPWQFSLTLRNADTFAYHCQIHGGVGTGMHGTIDVLPNDDVVFIGNFELYP